MFLTPYLRDKLSHKGCPIRLETSEQRIRKSYFVSINQVIYDEDDKVKNCQYYPTTNYASYADCDSAFTKNEYQAAFKTEDCVVVEEDITPIFATNNLDKVPNFDFANCTYLMDQFHGLFSGAMASPCLSPCIETQTNSALISSGKSEASVIAIVFDRKVKIDKITVDKFQLMESLNFFGSNLGLLPGLGIFQIIQWILENVVWKINITKVIEIIRQK